MVRFIFDRCSYFYLWNFKEFKLKAQLARHYAAAHGVAVRAGSPRPVMKTRAAFYLRTSPLTRLARRLSRALRRPRRVARSPFTPVSIHQVKQDCEFNFDISLTIVCILLNNFDDTIILLQIHWALLI